ncbi:hypothetical protein A3J41_02590 [candidate division TM6 bacterium RIFCSPHIGHO2_12_FULL_38_8]|nr:MAG: hypothetical protein A3J41_02590 [candidate division TM6 bacterium RIFCSPHIGHO2_12_FULL_38_8]
MKVPVILASLIMLPMIIHPDATDLSGQQLFQLQHLQKELTKYSYVAQTKWTSNDHVKTLIEMMQLAVQQSSPETQVEMQLAIIKIFRDFHIDIIFTADNFIEKIELGTPAVPIKRHKRKQPPAPAQPRHHHAPSSHAHYIPAIDDTIEHPARIHGANRTRKRLKAEYEARQKYDYFKKSTRPTPADSVGQKIWEETKRRILEEMDKVIEKKEPTHFSENSEV